MRAFDHLRKPGHLDAWKALNARAAADLDAKRGDIKKPRTVWAYYDSAKLLIARRLQSVTPFERKRA